jgi:hypothetical protein
MSETNATGARIEAAGPPPKPTDPALDDTKAGLAFTPSTSLFGAEPREGVVPSRCRVHLLIDAKPTERGVVYRRGDDRFLLEWPRVRLALASAVGEPEGVCTVVFDLALDVSGPECVLCRIDADPISEAPALARAIELGLGRDRCNASLKNLSRESAATRHYDDLDTLTEAHLEAIRFAS